jgi:hypothetical protein
MTQLNHRSWRARQAPYAASDLTTKPDKQTVGQQILFLVCWIDISTTITHQQWALLNALCQELGIPVRFGIGCSAQSNPKLYFRIIHQAVVVVPDPEMAGAPALSEVHARRHLDGWRKAYKVKPGVASPQPLATKDVWIVESVRRRDSAAPVFWGTRDECSAEECRLIHEASGEASRTTSALGIQSQSKRQCTLKMRWEQLINDPDHPYLWRYCGGSSHTKSYAFMLADASGTPSHYHISDGTLGGRGAPD